MALTRFRAVRVGGVGWGGVGWGSVKNTSSPGWLKH